MNVQNGSNARVKSANFWSKRRVGIYSQTILMIQYLILQPVKDGHLLLPTSTKGTFYAFFNESGSYLNRQFLNFMLNTTTIKLTLFELKEL